MVKTTFHGNKYTHTQLGYNAVVFSQRASCLGDIPFVELFATRLCNLYFSIHLLRILLALFLYLRPTSFYPQRVTLVCAAFRVYGFVWSLVRCTLGHEPPQSFQKLMRTSTQNSMLMWIECALKIHWSHIQFRILLPVSIGFPTRNY